MVSSVEISVVIWDVSSSDISVDVCVDVDVEICVDVDDDVILATDFEFEWFDSADAFRFDK